MSTEAARTTATPLRGETSLCRVTSFRAQTRFAREIASARVIPMSAGRGPHEQ
jgi:hypothetical protein